MLNRITKSFFVQVESSLYSLAINMGFFTMFMCYGAIALSEPSASGQGSRFKVTSVTAIVTAANEIDLGITLSHSVGLGDTRHQPY